MRTKKICSRRKVGGAHKQGPDTPERSQVTGGSPAGIPGTQKCGRRVPTLQGRSGRCPDRAHSIFLEGLSHLPPKGGPKPQKELGERMRRETYRSIRAASVSTPSSVSPGGPAGGRMHSKLKAACVCPVCMRAFQACSLGRTESSGPTESSGQTEAQGSGQRRDLSEDKVAERAGLPPHLGSGMQIYKEMDRHTLSLFQGGPRDRDGPGPSLWGAEAGRGQPRGWVLGKNRPGLAESGLTVSEPAAEGQATHQDISFQLQQRQTEAVSKPSHKTRALRARCVHPSGQAQFL